MIVKADVQRAFKERGLKVNGDVYDRLGLKVLGVIVDAADRAKQNGRKTVAGKDL